MKKIVILIGNYCSGKTEIAMNMAMLSASQGKRTQVIDLDRINDYFRMSDHIQMLIDKCINVVSPSFVGKGLTQTVMPAQVASAFDSDWDLVIFDVGGDQAGALSLARYHQDFAALEPGNVICAQFILQLVNDLLQRLDLPRKCQIVLQKCPACEINDLAHGVQHRLKFFFCRVRERNALFL